MLGDNALPELELQTQSALSEIVIKSKKHTFNPMTINCDIGNPAPGKSRANRPVPLIMLANT
jgi:hypothetical protein